MTIREIRRDEVPLATGQYLEACGLLWERDADWGVPDRDPIDRWILRTIESDGAVCLAPDDDHDGIAVCSSPPSPVIRSGIAWARDRGRRPDPNDGRPCVPWTEEGCPSGARLGSSTTRRS